MKRIYLTQGQVTLVDDEDYEYLNQWKWCAKWNTCTKSFYAVRGTVKPGGGIRIVQMHREILGLKHGDKREVDHIHHKTLDNRKSQIKIVTKQQNSFNRQNTKGYHFDKASGKFRAVIYVDGKRKCLGRYNTEQEAHAVYLKAKKKYHTIPNDNRARVRFTNAPILKHKPLFLRA